MMNQTKTPTTNLAAKSILAKLLATENIRVEHNPHASTASFDLKNRVLTCPVWADMDGDLYDMLLGHEVSHAKNTPPQGWHDAITEQTKKQVSYKHFLNIVEDARIEKLIKRQFPGLRRPFINAYKALHERDLFEVKGRAVSSMYFIDRVNLHCKMGFAMNIKFTTVERALLTLVEQAETWEDVCDATQKIWEYSKKEQKEDQDNTKKKLMDMSESLKSEDADESEDDDSDDYDEDFEESDEDADSDEESDEDADSDEESDEESDEDTETSKTTPSHDSKQPEGDNDFTPQAGTEESYRKNNKLLNAQNAPRTHYVTMPVPILKSIIVPEKEVNDLLSRTLMTTITNEANGRKLLLAFQEKNNTFINSLAKEFEMRKAAKKFVKAKITESGDIDLSKLGLFRTEDDIFKRIMTVKRGKNHGLVLVLDKSGSMRYNIVGAIEQVLILACFCRKVNIPFVAYGFITPAYKCESWNPAPKTLRLGGVNLREMINSSMKAVSFTRALMNHLMLAAAYSEDRELFHDVLRAEKMMSTPLNEALVSLIPIVQQFKRTKRLDLVNVVVVHDGDADSCDTYGHNDPKDYQNSGYERFSTYSERVYFRDAASGIEVLVPQSAGYRGETVGIMELLKKVCDVGIYGFYIGATGVDIRTYYRNADGSEVDASIPAGNYTRAEARRLAQVQAKGLMKRLRDEKFLESYTQGYNRFYLLPSGNDLEVKDTQVAINGTITARKLAAAFIKQGKAKYSNRVLVSRFIDLIAR